MIPLMRPDVGFDEVADDLRAVLDSGRLTSGAYVEALEAATAGVAGVPHAVATTSATTAMHLALRAAGVGTGDEVLVSDFTFPATGNVVVEVGGVPVLVDNASGRFDLDCDRLRSLIGPRTAAIIVVDPFGQPAELDVISEIASSRGLFLIEDAACALGASRAGRPSGSWPGAGCFSFHPRKLVTTGEGGMLTTADPDLAAKARMLRSHGGEAGDVGMVFTEHGFNYRLSELQAAVGLPQIRRLDQILEDRRTTAARYDSRLDTLAGVTVPRPPAGATWTYQSYVIWLDEDIDRDGVVLHLRERGVESTLGTYAMHAHPAFAHYGYSPGDLPVAWAAQQRSLTLPLLPRMEVELVDRVVSELAAALEQCRR